MTLFLEEMLLIDTKAEERAALMQGDRLFFLLFLFVFFRRLLFFSFSFFFLFFFSHRMCTHQMSPSFLSFFSFLGGLMGMRETLFRSPSFFLAGWVG